LCIVQTQVLYNSKTVGFPTSVTKDIELAVDCQEA
jgi:hypothetical protein